MMSDPGGQSRREDLAARSGLSSHLAQNFRDGPRITKVLAVVHVDDSSRLVDEEIGWKTDDASFESVELREVALGEC